MRYAGLWKRMQRVEFWRNIEKHIQSNPSWLMKADRSIWPHYKSLQMRKRLFSYFHSTLAQARLISSCVNNFFNFLPDLDWARTKGRQMFISACWQPRLRLELQHRGPCLVMLLPPKQRNTGWIQDFSQEGCITKDILVNKFLRLRSRVNRKKQKLKLFCD